MEFSLIRIGAFTEFSESTKANGAFKDPFNICDLVSGWQNIDLPRENVDKIVFITTYFCHNFGKTLTSSSAPSKM